MKRMKKTLMMLLSVVMILSSSFTTQAVEGNPFGDVKESDWYYPYAKFVVDNSLMVGKGNTADGKIRFDPATTMTRAEFVQVLYNMEGKPEVTYTNRFTDIPNPAVDKNAWYSKAVIWAAEQGIVSGKPDGSFGKAECITREQMAQMLMKYARVLGYETKQYASLLGFEDDEKISDWAVTAMEWAVGAGIMSGTTNNELLPTNSTIRAEAATMLKGFVDAYQIKIHKHTYAERIVVQPTCVANGKKETYCSICGHIKSTEDIPANGQHLYEQIQVGPCCVQTYCACGYSSYALVSGSVDEMLGYINAERANTGREPLTIDYGMCSAAQNRANQIVSDYSHNGNNTGYAENINMALSVSDCYYSWAGSSGHYSNMIGFGYTRMGFAWASGPDAVYFVALFD